MGEVIYAAPTKKNNSGGNGNSGSGGGTLGRRNRRGQHNSALSSSSTASDRSETIYPDEHSRMHLNNGDEKVCAMLCHSASELSSVVIHRTCAMSSSRRDGNSWGGLEDGLILIGNGGGNLNEEFFHKGFNILRNFVYYKKIVDLTVETTLCRMRFYKF
ncbi:hypothetical protein PV327_001551 [Microctonus hyperodae]|uniref:Uncharacterized protein n=1 Tax=Microctonus hyperodae TaxID=165561 RepID=A0AA39GAI9_MICHY|nr:hypothetical protein PV327_001551 [Microctonus hyperodae]